MPEPSGLHSAPLGVVELPIVPVPPGKLLRTSALYDFSSIDHQHGIRVADSGEAVGDDKTRPAFHELDHSELDPKLRPGVHRAGSLVEDQESWGCQDRAGYRDELALALAQVRAGFREHRVIAVGKPFNGVVSAGQGRGLSDLLLGSLGSPVANVLPHGPREQPPVLRHDPEGPPQALAAVTPGCPTRR